LNKLGESTRPNADDINPKKEIERILPLFDFIKSTPQITSILSIDTTKVIDYRLNE
jgi:Dihydropteroate synthase and related enzymes